MKSEIVLLSAPGREDVAELHLAVHRLVWRECPWEIRVDAGDTRSGWTKRLLATLERTEREVLFLNLDDYPPCRPPDTETILRAASFLEKHPRFASIYLDRSGYRPERACELAGFGLYDSSEPIYKRTQLLPVLARVEAWKEMTKQALSALSEEQDVGWVGAYNFELFSARPSLSFEIAAPLAGLRQGPFALVDLTLQDLWTPWAGPYLEGLGLTLPASPRKRFSGESPYMDQWMAARRAAQQ